MTPWLTDAEVDAACVGLTQPAAKIRHLRRLGLRVDRKPNGAPLVWRPQAVASGAPGEHNAPAMNVVALDQWASARKKPTTTSTQPRTPHGPQTQRR